MAFRFSLQDLLDYRVEIEHTRQQEHAAAQQKLESARQEAEKLKGQKQGIQGKLRAAMTGEVNLSEKQLYDNYLASLNQDIEEAKVKVAMLAEEAERRREALVEAMREREILEKLSEEEFEQYRKESEMRETFALDDYSAMKNGKENSALQQEQNAEGDRS